MWTTKGAGVDVEIELEAEAEAGEDEQEQEERGFIHLAGGGGVEEARGKVIIRKRRRRSGSSSENKLVMTRHVIPGASGPGMVQAPPGVPIHQYDLLTRQRSDRKAFFGS